MTLLMSPQNVSKTCGSVGAAGPSGSACCPSQPCWHNVPLSILILCCGALSLEKQPRHQSCRDLNTVLMICCCCLSGLYHTKTMQSRFFFIYDLCVWVFGIALGFFLLLINWLIHRCPGLLSQKKVQWHWTSLWKKSQDIHPFLLRRQVLAFWQQLCPGEGFPVTQCQKLSKKLLNHWYVTF